MAGEGKLDKLASKLSFWGSCEKSCESRKRKDVRVCARSWPLAWRSLQLALHANRNGDLTDDQGRIRNVTKLNCHGTLKFLTTKQLVLK